MTKLSPDTIDYFKALDPKAIDVLFSLHLSTLEKAVLDCNVVDPESERRLIASRQQLEGARKLAKLVSTHLVELRRKRE